MIKQTRIQVSGCNIWKKQVIACATDKFAFASTLAIQIYDLKNFQLIKLLNSADVNITAIAWQPIHEKYLAQGTYNRQFAIWDLETEKIKFQLNLTSNVIQIEWNRQNVDEIFILLQNNELKKVQLNSQKVMDVRIDYGPIKPKVIRMHPRLEDISAFGMSNGVVLFYNQKTTKSYSLNCVRGHAPANEESKGEDIKFSVSDMSWDPHEENILVAVKNAGVCLISFQGISNTTQIIQTFNAKSRKICNLFWSDDKSGNFVTANEDQGTLTVWNAATPQPRKVLKVGNSVIKSMLPITNQSSRVVIGFQNGAISLYNLSKQKVEFQTESGHSETIFGIDYHPTETNLLASCSYDGSVRVWDVSLNKLVSINDTTKQPQQSKFDKKIIYACSWHPKLTKIAMCTINGYLLVYDALKGKLLASLAPKEGHPSYKVDWNKLEPKNILMTSVANAIFVVGVMDQPKCSQLTVQRWYTSPAPVFGCAWSPRDPSIFMTGNKDGRVRIYDYSNIADGPIRTFEGHAERVYNVIFNANLPNLIASGSDDRTIRIWDLNQASSTSIQVLGGQVNHSHTSNVRALAFLPEITWCLLSGSWDSTIKLWDIRTGACMLTLNDHNSDVYGICFQYNRPFVFTTCSRDTTIRHFSIDGLVQQLKLKLLCGKEALMDINEVVQSPEETHKLRGKYKLCSMKALDLVTDAQTAPAAKSLQCYLAIFDYLYQQEGQAELLQILYYLGGTQSDQQKDGMKVLHAQQLSEAFLDRASYLRSATGMKLLNTQFAKKEDRLEEVAKYYLSCGKFKDYCEVQFELGNHAKAMAFAPAVSIDYWQELAERRAELSLKEESEDAAYNCINANKLADATQIFESREEYEDAKLVRSLQIQGIFKSVLQTIQQKPGFGVALQKKFELPDEILTKIVVDEAEEFFTQGKVCLAAAAYLSINEFRSCLQVLVRGNELYLAFIIAKHFCKEALPEIALLLAERAEKYFCADLAMQLVTKYASDSKTASLVKRRLLNSGLLKDATKDTAVQSLPSVSTADVVSRVHSLIVENQLSEACKLTAASMKRAYDGQESPETLFYLNDLIQQANLIKVPKESKHEVLYFSAFVAIFKALHFGYFETILQLQTYFELINATSIDQKAIQFIRCIITDLSKLRAEKRSKPLSTTDFQFGGDASLKAKFDTFNAAFVAVQKCRTVLFQNAGFYQFSNSGAHLKGESISAFSEAVIKGQAFSLEDGRTKISQEEALQWTMCCRFSCLGNGYRINPW